MSLEALVNFGEFVSGIAVVISLIYLAMQVRANSEHLKENTASIQGASEIASRNGPLRGLHEKATLVKTCSVSFSYSPWRQNVLGFQARDSTMLPFALLLAFAEAGARWGP